MLKLRSLGLASPDVSQLPTLPTTQYSCNDVTRSCKYSTQGKAQSIVDTVVLSTGGLTTMIDGEAIGVRNVEYSFHGISLKARQVLGEQTHPKLGLEEKAPSRNSKVQGSKTRSCNIKGPEYGRNLGLSLTPFQTQQ